MTSSSRVGSPLGLARAQQRVSARKAGALRIVAHNGASIWGGGEIYLTRLLVGLQQRGHEVTLCCNHELVADRATRYLVPSIVRPLRGDLMFGDALNFARFLRQQQPDVLFVSTFNKVWLAGLAAQRAGVPLTIARVGLTSHTPRRWKYRYALRNWFDVAALNAESMRAGFLRGDPRLDPDKVVTLLDGVERPVLRQAPGALRTTLRIPPGAPVIGALARLSRQKRLERLVAVTAQLPGVHCIVAGDGGERGRLQREAERLGVQDRMHLLGFRDDIGDVLSALDVFVITSDQEGMANAMLEALTLGVPVVSTPVSGAQEALEPGPHGPPGRIVAGFEPEQIVPAVRALLEQPELRERMSSAARERARERFSFERMLNDFETLLRDRLSAREAGA
jgi:glycosyltransferase involved in cell wall biosynthesis